MKELVDNALDAAEKAGIAPEIEIEVAGAVAELRELRRQSPESAFVFATERGGPFTLGPR